jgi:heme A synthase
MIHRGFGCIVAIVTTIAAIQVFRRTPSWPSLRKLALVAPMLVGLQIFLGIEVVLTWRAVPLAVAHFAGAAALWGLWTTAYLVSGPRSRTRPAPAEAVAV